MITVEYPMHGKNRLEWLEELSYLWKVDDKTWLENRKAEWKYLAKNQYADNTAKDNKKYLQYYVYGKGNEYIPAVSKYLFTPFQSAAEAKLVFEVLFDHNDHKILLSEFINIVGQRGEGLPWLRSHVQYFVEGVLGDEYQEIQEKARSGGHLYRISPSPDWWCRTYISRAVAVLNQNVIYSGCIDCVPYFVSSLPHFKSVKERKRSKFISMLLCVDQVLAKNETTSLHFEFAKGLKKFEDEIKKNWALNEHLDTED